MSEREGENYKLEERGRSKAESEQAMAPSEAMARPWECDGAGAGVAAGARAEAGSLHSFSSFYLLSRSGFRKEYEEESLLQSRWRMRAHTQLIYSHLLSHFCSYYCLYLHYTVLILILILTVTLTPTPILSNTHEQPTNQPNIDTHSLHVRRRCGSAVKSLMFCI